MPWDGNGGFSRTNGVHSGATTWANSRDAGSNIEPTLSDVHDQDLAAGIGACITKDGQSKPSADFKPNADNQLSLGSSLLRWLTAWVSSLKITNGSNFTATLGANALTAHRAIELPDVAGTLAIAGEAAFEVGTRIVFQQTAAPSGWTKQTGSQYNDAALRMTTGTVSTGGADAFSTHFGTSKTTASMTLALSQSPAHAHTGEGDSGIRDTTPGGAFAVIPSFTAKATSSAGGGGSHTHSLSNFNIKYADCIICAKA